MVKVRVGRLVHFLVLLAVCGVMTLTLYDVMFLKHVRRDRPLAETAESHETRHSDPTLMIDDTAARALQARSRVLCWIPSTPKHLGGKVRAVNSTWVQRCDGHIFFVEGPGMAEYVVTGTTPWDVVSLDVPPGYYNLTTKVVTIMLYLYRYHLQDYDWFLKGDDDAYVVMENLRYVLSHHDPRHPVYLGHPYKRFLSQGYMSGGAAYVLSREALRRVVEEGYKKNRCRTKGSYEDLEVARCLHGVGIGSFSSRDRFGRDAFHPLRPATHIVGPIPANQAPQDYFPMVAGKECCSQLTISFHKVDPTLMRIVDHLLYRTSVYGRVLDMPALEGLIQPGQIPPRES